MARSKSSAGYPSSFKALLEKVGIRREEVRIPVLDTGLKATGLRTTLQCYFAAVRKEGLGEGEFSPQRALAEIAQKIIVRIQGEEVVISHKDNDALGLLVSAACDGGGTGKEAAIDGFKSAPVVEKLGVQGEDRLGRIERTPESMLGMVAAEEGPRMDRGGKWKRTDGRAVPLGEDGEPLYGVLDNGEGKVNTFF